VETGIHLNRTLALEKKIRV